MEQKYIYLDNAATEKPCRSILNKANKLITNYYNPSSINQMSLKLKTEIEDVRYKIAKEINCDPEEIIFTSGASESNSLAISGFKKEYPSFPIISSMTEHSSIKNNINAQSKISVNKDGTVNHDELNKYKGCLVCIIHGNSEVGTINPIKKISDVIHKNGCYLFCDATASFGKTPINVKDLGVDMLSASGHKIGSLKGAGFLYVNKQLRISPIIYGTQEQNLRGGTYNYMAIKSLGLAIDEIDYNKEKKIEGLRNYLISRLLKIGNITLNGSLKNRLPNNVNICINDVPINSQQIVSLLELEGFIVSSGTACHAGSNEPSETLMAMYNDTYIATHSIRITMSKENTKEEIDRFVESLKNIIDINRTS